MMHIHYSRARGISWITKQAEGDAGIAAVSVEISTGCWHVKTQKIRTDSVLEAELKAILLALSRAIELGWQEVHILSDSKIVVQALSPLLARGVPDWRVADVYYNILSKLLTNFNWFLRLSSFAHQFQESFYLVTPN
ncbi:hypothetical protein F8388_022296 [Cannabis sativa]|uniref:RNase H type-1 domain-containing protein n=1 Tax=Cannabis sativa TaxID=3483 RepID=A0A7J6E9T9_CANSA|nr:hypothetical protein F8388_022296 [Cannabis sativa]KAF4360092.1 hypothetical protein G4B88_005245 [Cannabis sativa]